MAITMYLSIITVNVNGLNALSKRHKVAEWIRKQDPCICYFQATHFRSKDTQTESKETEKDISYKWKWKKKSGVAILISDKIDIKKRLG